MTEPAKELTLPSSETPRPPAPMPWLEEMPPRQIVAELDRYIVGQEAAKKAVAIAVRNRWRRAQAPDDIRDEITPYNIIMIGPTGVGKTEVARRLARLSGAPFIKVEASKFTEVGYVGRDAESMVRDLVDSAINMVRTEREDEVYPQAEQRADERLLDLLLPASPPPPAEKRARADASGRRGRRGDASVFVVSSSGQAKPERALSPEEERRSRSREKLRQHADRGSAGRPRGRGRGAAAGLPHDGADPAAPGDRGHRHQLHRDAAGHAAQAEEAAHGQGAGGAPDPGGRGAEEAGGHGRRGERVARPGGEPRHHLHRRDRQDRRASGARRGGPDVSREGVQRDLLPIVEGSTVQTRYGYVRSDHILFIAAGAFHVSKPSRPHSRAAGPLPHPGRAPAAHRAGLRPDHDRAGERAHQAVSGAGRRPRARSSSSPPDGIAEVARVAFMANDRMENIGARRLHTVMAALMEDVLFELPDYPEKRIVFDEEGVRQRLARIISDDDLRRYIL